MRYLLLTISLTFVLAIGSSQTLSLCMPLANKEYSSLFSRLSGSINGFPIKVYVYNSSSSTLNLREVLKGISFNQTSLFESRINVSNKRGNSCIEARFTSKNSDCKITTSLISFFLSNESNSITINGLNYRHVQSDSRVHLFRSGNSYALVVYNL
jgi:hypothetical protein